MADHSAGLGRPSPDRVVQRNGYRYRDLDTCVGMVDVAVPKLWSGTYGTAVGLVDPLTCPMVWRVGSEPNRQQSRGYSP